MAVSRLAPSQLTSVVFYYLALTGYVQGQLPLGNYHSFGEHLVLIFYKRISLILQFWRGNEVGGEINSSNINYKSRVAENGNRQASPTIGTADGNSEWDTPSSNKENEPTFTHVPVLQIAVEYNVSSQLYSSLISLAKDIHSNPDPDQKETVNTPCLHCNHIFSYSFCIPIVFCLKS